VKNSTISKKPETGGIRLFLCGDVMTGRGIDQIMRHSVDPVLYEPWIRDAREYIALAEEVNGPVSRPVDDAYVWGDALGILNHSRPDASIINLETAITSRGKAWPRKGIHYRMHPANSSLLLAAGIDCCVLANNHVLDWSYDGLDDTLKTLGDIGIGHAGAGLNDMSASAPAIVTLPSGGRVLVFALAFPDSGVPHSWKARRDRPGVNLVMDSPRKAIETMASEIARHRRPGDIVVTSIHWGGNWGYRIPRERQMFAHALIDSGLVDIVHGHSSHHPIGIEVYREKLILYSCGDLLNDYEGISEHQKYRGDLSLMYFPLLNPEDGHLLGLEMHAMQIRKFQLQIASEEDTRLLKTILSREGALLGTDVDRTGGNRLVLTWG
jgi:poly-gamma-glutamate synthesis protein (capsule biosynthesis protein)